MFHVERKEKTMHKHCDREYCAGCEAVEFIRRMDQHGVPPSLMNDIFFKAFEHVMGIEGVEAVVKHMTDGIGGQAVADAVIDAANMAKQTKH